MARVVVLADSGHITLDAIRWLEGAGIAWCAVDARSGELLSSSTHGASDDARIRRAQALAMGNGVGLTIARALVEGKLAGQASVAEGMLGLPILASDIEELRAQLAESATLEGLRSLEAAAANVFWAGWGTVKPTFVRKDVDRVPEHWRGFSGRRSSVASDNRRATTPANAMLNYSYRLLEAEGVFATRAMGLDPGLGILHADVVSRKSFVLDVIEAVRPEVDRHVLRILQSTPLRWRDFDEDDRGIVRVLSPLTHRLAEATPSYARVLAPVVEWVASTLGKASPYDVTTPSVLTRDKHRKVARTAAQPSSGRTVLEGAPPQVGLHLRHTQRQAPTPPGANPALPLPVCKVCGVTLEREDSRPRRRGAYCPACLAERRRELGVQVRDLGAAASKPGPETRVRQSAANSAQRLAEQLWEFEHEGELLNKDWYLTEVLPRLQTVSLPMIAKATGMSTSAASKVRRGLRVPHPRWWESLSRL